MVRPILAVILDGLGDRPHPDFGGETPLSAAQTPSLDRLAANGSVGLIDPLGPGIVPGSATGHLGLFDYDPLSPGAARPSRGCIEALGLGVEPRDHLVAIRGNFVSLDAAGRLVDRRAGRFSEPRDHEEASQLVAAMNEAMGNGVRFLYDARMGYRFVVLLEDASFAITDTDPGRSGLAPLDPKPTDGTPRARETAARLRGARDAARKALADHDANAGRRKRGAPPANGFITRGAGPVERGPTLSERFGLRCAAIAGGNAYRGFAAYVGMRLVPVPGATGDLRTDYAAKVSAAVSALRDVDLVYLHIKAPDVCGENGDFPGKRDVLERIDRALAPLITLDDAVIGVTGDHSTPCTRKTHSADPVPLLFSGPSVRRDSIGRFNETACAVGGLGRLRGGEFLASLLDLADRTKKTE